MSPAGSPDASSTPGREGSGKQGNRGEALDEQQNRQGLTRTGRSGDHTDTQVTSMHMMTDGQLALSPSSRAMRDLFLAKLDQPQPVRLGGNTGLPAEAVDCVDQNLIVAVTPVTERLYDDALLRFADRSRRDVVLVRHGFHPETLDPVRVDVALRTSFGSPILVPDLSLWRGTDGSLHLVPDGNDLFVEVAGHGLDALLVRPWNGWEERCDGLTRAAAEVVRAVARARAGEQA